MKVRFKKRKKTKVWAWNPWNQEAEAGDLMVGYGCLYRLQEPRGGGRGASAAGILYPRRILPPDPKMKAIKEGQDIYWMDQK